jgi:ribose transport system permease protein
MSNTKVEKKYSPIFNPLTDLVKTNGGILIALAIMAIGLSFSTEYFMTTSNLQNVFNYFTTNCMLAFCMMVVLITGEIDLSISALVAVSGILLCVLMNAGVPFVAAMAVTLLIGAGIGLFTGAVIAFSGMPSFIVTLAMQGVLRGVAYIISAGERISSPNMQFFNLAAGKVLGVPIPTIIVLVIAFLLYLLLSRTIFGKHMYATGGNREAAVYSGIKVRRVVITTFALSGALACVAGAFVASRVTSGQPTAGTGYEGDAVAAAVLGGTAFTGGRGTVIGTILGALVIGVLSNGLNLLEVSYYWQLVCKGLIIMLAVMIDTIKQRRTA